jgi:hypothetical protein
MTDQLVQPPTTFVTPPEPIVDLSSAIAKQVEKRPSDRVTVRLIHGRNYRVNWWAPGDTRDYDNPAMFGPTVTTHHVRKSQFLRVTQTAKGLSIEVVSSTKPRE